MVTKIPGDLHRRIEPTLPEPLVRRRNRNQGNFSGVTTYYAQKSLRKDTSCNQVMAELVLMDELPGVLFVA